MRKKEPRPTKIFNLKNLHAVWKGAADNCGEGKAPGVDGQSAEKFKAALEDNIKAIRCAIINGQYQFERLKPYPIPKANGKTRIICVPTVQDRLVQRAILKHITIGSERLRGAGRKDLLGATTNISYGVVKGRDQGVLGAIDQAVKMRSNNPWILKTDISAFFDNIPRAHLIGMLQKKREAQSVLPLLIQIVNLEIDDRAKSTRDLMKKNKIEKGKGLRQGMPLSPLLANLILAPFDKKITGKGYKALRYIDDLIVFTNSREECEQAEQVVKTELKEIELSIPGLQEENSKTQIRAPADPVEFLGVEIYRQSEAKYATRIPAKVMTDKLEEIAKYGKYTHCVEEKLNLTTSLQRLHNIPKGYDSAYKHTTNLSDFLETLRAATDLARKSLLEDVFGEDYIDRLPKGRRDFLGLLLEEEVIS